MRFPEWSELRSVGQSGAARASILMPLVGYLIVFNETVLSALSSSFAILGGDLKLSSLLTWRIYSLYIGMFLMGVASIFFQFFCPRHIKQYKDPEDYIRTAAAITTRKDLSRQIIEINTDAIACRKDDWAFLRSKIDLAMEITNDDRSDFMKTYYEYSSKKAAFLRGVVTLVYLAAFIGLTLPSVDTFVRALSHVVW